MPIAPSAPDIAGATESKFVRRLARIQPRSMRMGFQVAFAVLNVWLGVQFYFWVRHFETFGASRFVDRPAGVDGWLPVASLMNLRYMFLEFSMPDIHPAGVFLLVAFIAISLLFRKAFCSWLCPVGTLSEYLWKLGRRSFRRNFKLPRWADIPLRGLKYLLLAFFIYIIGSMEASAIDGFLASPYGIISDVKMLNFFRFMSTTTALTLSVLVILSIFIQNFWCRYLCPYGALMGLFAFVSPTRIERNVERCIDCDKCAKTCPSRLPVNKLIQIRSAECTGCLECVAVCPSRGALDAAVGFPLMATPTRKLSAAWFAAGIAVVFFGIVIMAKASDHWQMKVVPYSVYQQLVPGANRTSHPMR